MSDNAAQELRIHIISDADTRGFSQSAAASKQLKVDTSDLSDETKRSLGVLPQLEDNLKKSGHAAEESGLSHRELRRVLSDIGNVAAPGAGAALGELAFGPVGAALALVGAYEAVKKTLEAAIEAADKLAEELAKPDTAGIKGVQEAWDEATKKYGEYLAAVENAGKDKDPIKTEVERAKQLVLAKYEGQKKIAEATGDTAGAAYYQNQIDRTNQSSLITEQMRREQAQPELQAAAAEAAEAAAAEARKFKNDQAKLEHSREALDEKSAAGKALRERIEKAGEALETAQAEPDFSPQGRDLRADKGRRISEAQADLDAANQELANSRKEVAQLEASEVQRAKAKAAAEEEAKTKAEAVVNNAGRLNQLPGEINQAGALTDINEHSRKVVDILNAHGGQTNESLQQLAQSLGYTHGATLNMVERIVSGLDSYNARMAQLEAKLASMPNNLH